MWRLSSGLEESEGRSELMTLEELTQWLLNKQQAIWQAEWDMRDACRAIAYACPREHRKSLLQALQETSGISHQKLRRWALEAKLVPPDERAEDRAPISQIRQAREA